MSMQHFWVVGGEYRSLSFDALVPGSAEAEGPFPSRREAEDAWRRLSEGQRHRCTVRYTIVAEAGRSAA